MVDESRGPSLDQLGIAGETGATPNSDTEGELVAPAEEPIPDQSQEANAEQASTPFTPEDIAGLKETLSREQDQVSEKIAAEHPELTVRERAKLAQQERERLTQDLLGKLIKEKDRFQSVFTTEKGSTYFVMESGQAMRFKVDEEDGLKIQPMLNNIVYLSDAVKENLYALGRKRRFENIIGVRIPLSPLVEGARVFEFNGLYPNGDTEFEIGDDAQGRYLRLWGNYIPEQRREFHQGPGAVPPEDRQPASVSLEQLVEYSQGPWNAMSEEMKQYWEKFGRYEFGGLFHFGHGVTEVIK